MPVMTIMSKQGSYRFAAIFHPAEKPEDFHLDPVTFYEQWGKSIPQGLHYEVEIIEPEEKFFEQHVLHIARSRKNGKLFICYPRPIPTLEDAVQVFRTWCLGSVLTITNQIDLNTILKQAGGDKQNMEEILNEQFGIYEKP